MNFLQAYKNIRQQTVDLCAPLKIEDYVVQPIRSVSPPKWHLGHTTWFFENLILKTNDPTYEVYNKQFAYIFNSYYESAGAHVLKANRGALSRPTVEETMAYRHYVDEHMEVFLAKDLLDEKLIRVLETGLNHEQQHQELLLMDIKYIFGFNPLQPVYDPAVERMDYPVLVDNYPITVEAGVYEIGNDGSDFCYDNERHRHKVYLNKYAMDSGLVTNGDFLRFVEQEGYKDYRFWHSNGWDWVQHNQVQHPLYWEKERGEWYEYTLGGKHPLVLSRPVCHVSYYEAAAFASWAKMRLPTEAEWEVAADQFDWGLRWEWTESAYLPYPGYRKPEGALGEYNAKFMVNQMVLRGACEATPKNHSRKSYRNFFYANERWPFTGIRLAQSIN